MIRARAAVIVAAAGVFLVLIASAQAQQPAPRTTPNDVQVGVPAGGRGRGAPPGGRRGRGPAGPAPRSAATGRVLLQGRTPSEKGVWLPDGVVTTSFAPAADIPFQPWAKALYEDRQTHRLEPHARCKPSGAARQVQTPYGVEFVELPELRRIYIFDIGGPHTWRTVYMDGRTHPERLTPSYYGHSIGWWEGDTLVIDTVGYNEDFWLDRGGTPHTRSLHTLERFTRTDSATIRYELTLDDPMTFTRPWGGGFNLRWETGTELFEYVCQEQNYAGELMVGASVETGKVDRSSLIVP
jgi:hypothetical protein